MTLSFQGVRLRAGAFALTLTAELRGSMIGIFGASGSGKTTLLEGVAGLRLLDAGRLCLGETLLADAASDRHVPPERRRIGYVPQNAALFPHLSVDQNLQFGERRLRGRGDPLFSRAHVCDVLGIGHLLARAPTRLSIGEQQRVALARALVSQPTLLLLDEPLASLDSSRKDAILPYLKRIREEFHLPTLYVSHAAEEIVALCEEVLVLADGKLIAHAPPETLFEQTTEPRFRLRKPHVPGVPGA